MPASTAITHVFNAVDPRFVMPIFDGAFAAGADYLDMAMSLSRPHPDVAVREDRRDARRRAVRQGRRVGGGRPARAGRHRDRAGAVRRVRAVRRRPPVRRDRRDRRAGRREPRGRDGYDFAPSFSHLDHDRGVPEPAGGVGEGPRLVHHRAVQRAGGLRLPGGHRPGRVRERRARGGAAHPALGGREAGHLQVRAGRRVHHRAVGAAQDRSGPHREGARRRRRGVAAGRGGRLPAGPGHPRRQDDAARPAPAPG